MEPILRNKMLARMNEVRSQVAERDTLIEVIAIALLTRKNVFILGDTGQAKSYAVNLFRAGITGARQFERLMSKQTDEEALFGRLDLSSLIPGGVPEEVLEQDTQYQGMRQALETRLTSGSETASLVEQMKQYREALSAVHSGTPSLILKGKIPDSHICFLDEIFKSNDGILNALLTVLNERRYTNEGKTIDIPTISFFSASNELPDFSDPEAQILKPLYDRFELKVVTEYVEDRNARLAILKQKQSQQGPAAPSAVITLNELLDMQADVRATVIPDSINELMDDVLCELRSKNFHISDRKYFGYAPIVQAKAWLEGRGAVEPQDLIILRHYLWTVPEERSAIQDTLERMCSDPISERMNNILLSALESLTDFEDAAEAPPVRRIGKLREEYLRLYEQLEQIRTSIQSDVDRQKLDECLSALEGYSRKAHKIINFAHVPLSELHLFKVG